MPTISRTLSRALVLGALALPLPIAGAAAQSTKPPALSAIDTATLRRDMDFMASDAMRGREAGTLDELRASGWVAERARDAGLLPAGDDGTYFQWWPMRRIQTSDRSTVALDGAPLTLWKDVAVATPVDAQLTLPLVWIGDASADSIAKLDLKGRAVAAMIVPPARPPVSWISLRPWRYTMMAIGQRVAELSRAGAAAIVLVADDSTDSQFVSVGTMEHRGMYADDSAGAERPPVRTPTVWLPMSHRAHVMNAKTLTLDLHADSYVYPSVNVVAKVPGTDPKRRGEYVLFSGHQDHDGVRWPMVPGDSIWNGADDNASTSVALLAIGRAFVKHPAPRTALFVWHGAEERGLLGSRWYAAHPTVPRDSIVAVLNGDMLGRNTPDSAALLGAQPPHRNSTQLVDMALDANAKVGHFALDTLWDRPTHPENWYFRSDHLPYARVGIPAIFFTTLLHPDYHTPRDEASRIDIPKLARVARWMYATGWEVATAPKRPAVDPGFRLER
jgi:hypothetical protein